MSDGPTIHAIVTEYESFGRSLTSPQYPGLFWDCAPGQPLQEQALSALRAAGAPTEFRLQLHLQRYYNREDREWMVCVAQPSTQERLKAVRELEKMLQATPRPIDDADKTSSGEAVFVPVVPSDTVGWVGGLVAPGEVVSAALPAGDGIAFIDLSHPIDPDPDAVPLDPTLTMGQLFGMQPAERTRIPTQPVSGPPSPWAPEAPTEVTGDRPRVLV